MNVEVSTHQAHRDLLAVYFANHPYEIVSWETLEQLVGRNYQQRISDVRTQLKMDIENIKRTSPEGKRLTGDYRYRLNALGRDAADLVNAKPQGLFDSEPGAYRA